MSQINFGTWESLTVGIRLDEGVILAGTKKIAYGHMIMGEGGKNIFVLDNIGFGFAGHVSDLQSLIKEIRYEMNYLKLQLNRPPTIHSIANRLGLILYSRKFFPYITFAVVAGVDPVTKKPILYSLDPVGSVMEEDYAASGFSMDIVTGVLEDGYDPKLSIEEGKDLILRTMKVAAKRDVYSSKKIDLAILTKDKVIEETVTLDI